MRREGVSITQRKLERIVGIKLGMRHFLTGGDGRRIGNPRFYGRTLERIKVVQHWLSRRGKGSKDREEQRMKLARLHERLINRRDDFLHKLSRF